MQFEFTSRYGDNTPSALRACGECEAMGCYPVKAHAEGDTAAGAQANLIGSAILGYGSDLQDDLIERERSQVYARIEAGHWQADGWYILPCDKCEGTGSVSWLRTFARVPWWIIKGVRFIWDTRRYNADAGVFSNMWMSFKCAFLVDLGLWKP